MVQHLLSKTEIAFIQDSSQFTKAQARCIRYRLNKKLRTLNVELADLQQQLLAPSSSVSNFRGGVAELRDGQAALVAQPGRALPYTEKDKIIASLGRELNPRPLLPHCCYEFLRFLIFSYFSP